MTFRVESIKTSWKMLALITFAMMGATGLQQASAFPGPAVSSTAVEACVSKALGVGRAVTSPSDCRQDEYFVTVYQPERQVQAMSSPASAALAEPDLSALMPSLNAYVSLFAQASGRSKKDCQGVFNGKYLGRLKDFANWCDDAKSYEVREQCSQQVGGSPDAPTLACTEDITIYLKNGDPQHSNPQKTFHFSRSPDGVWEISGW